MQGGEGVLSFATTICATLLENALDRLARSWVAAYRSQVFRTRITRHPPGFGKRTSSSNTLAVIARPGS